MILQSADNSKQCQNQIALYISVIYYDNNLSPE